MFLRLWAKLELSFGFCKKNSVSGWRTEGGSWSEEGWVCRGGWSGRVECIVEWRRKTVVTVVVGGGSARPYALE